MVTTKGGKKGYKPLVVIMGINRPEDQARYKGTLENFDLRFTESHSAAMGMLPKAVVLAVPLDQESLLTKAIKGGFDGHLVPIMSGKKQKLILPDGKSISAVSCRDAPDRILNFLTAHA